MSSPSLSLSLSLFFSCLPFLSLLPFLCPFSCAPSRGGRPGQDLIRRFITYERWQGHAAMLGQPRLLTAGNYTLLGTRLGPEPTDTRHPPNSSPSSFFRKPLPSSLANIGKIPLRCPRLVLSLISTSCSQWCNSVFLLLFFWSIHEVFSPYFHYFKFEIKKRERKRERDSSPRSVHHRSDKSIGPLKNRDHPGFAALACASVGGERTLLILLLLLLREKRSLAIERGSPRRMIEKNIRGVDWLWRGFARRNRVL